VHGVRCGGIDGIQAEQEQHNHQRQQPSVSQTGISEAVEERPAATALGLCLAGGFVRIASIEWLSGGSVCVLRAGPGLG
jgi:hypothetical protein